MEYNNDQININPKWILTLVLFVFLIFVGFKSYAIVPPGHSGIKVRFGEVMQESYSEGLVMKVPFVEEVVLMEVRTMKLLIRAKAESKDLQSVFTQIVLNYHPDKDQVHKLYGQIGPMYETRVVEPALQETFKQVTATYNAEELITKRQAVRVDMEADLKVRLAKDDIQLVSLSITEFNFSDSYADAIEKKQVAEQDALRAENELRRVTTEQQQKIAIAKAEAEARIEKAQAEAKEILLKAEAEAKALEMLSIAAKPAALKARTIEKWDGVLPKVTSGGIPLLELDVKDDD